jgi:hypothetical protein
VALTVEFGSNLKIGGIVLVGGSENQPAAEHQSLWSGTRTNQCPQLSALGVGQTNSLGEWEWHW